MTLLPTPLIPVVAIIAGVLVLRTVVVLRGIHCQRGYRKGSPPPLQRTHPIATVVVLGSGGHTTEMLQLLQSLRPEYYTPLTYIVAQTDTTSVRRVAAMNVRSANHTYFIPRSREVGQSYVTSILTTVWSLIYSLGLILKIRPGLLLCNGPGTCLPIAVWTFLGRILGLWEGKIVFCESFCRVKTLSLTGKLLYPIVDLFVVHWEQLQTKFPRSHLVTTFVVPKTLPLNVAVNSGTTGADTKKTT
jgi:beta-1,4-N-acetylglucosaminyltransferase